MTTRELVSLCLVCTLAGAVGGGVGGELVRGWRQGKDIAKAEEKHEEQTAFQEQAGQHNAKATVYESQSQARGANVDALTRQLADLIKRQSAANPNVAPSPDVALRDQIISELTEKSTAQDKQIAELKAEAGDLRDALKAADARAESLQGALKHAPRIYRHAAGPEIHSDGYKGVTYEYTAGRVTVGGSVLLGKAQGAPAWRASFRVLGRW